MTIGTVWKTCSICGLTAPDVVPFIGTDVNGVIQTFWQCVDPNRCLRVVRDFPS